MQVPAHTISRVQAMMIIQKVSAIKKEVKAVRLIRRNFGNGGSSQFLLKHCRATFPYILETRNAKCEASGPRGR
jgi:hypothetical protein